MTDESPKGFIWAPWTPGELEEALRTRAEAHPRDPTRKIASDFLTEVTCPGCGSDDLRVTGGPIITCLGWFSDDTRDPNRHKTWLMCEACDLPFELHVHPAEQSAWYVSDDGKVLKGEPTLTRDHYAYPCQQEGCEGWIRHKVDSDVCESECGIKFQIVGYTLEGGKSVPQQNAWWECDACKHREQDECKGAP